MRHKLLFFLFFLLFLLLGHFSKGNTSIDSLFNNLKEINDDSLKVDALIDLSIVFCDSNVDKAVFYARQALNLSNRINYKSGIAKSNLNFGKIFLKPKIINPLLIII